MTNQQLNMIQILWNSVLPNNTVVKIIEDHTYLLYVTLVLKYWFAFEVINQNNLAGNDEDLVSNEKFIEEHKI